MISVGRILSVLVIVALGSCSKFSEGEGAAVSDKVPISFSPALKVSVAVKSPSMTTDVLKRTDTGFGVSAIATKKVPFAETASRVPSFIYDRRIVWDGTKWMYDPLEYWPTISRNMISFFAYAPWGAEGITLSGTGEGADLTKIDFELAQKSDETVDFVAGCKIDETGSRDDQIVQFTMRPELTRLEMFAKASEDLYSEVEAAHKTRIIIKSAVLSGPQMYRSAVYNYNTQDSAGSGSWDFSGTTPESYPLVLNGKNISAGTDYSVTGGVALLQKGIMYQVLGASSEEPAENYIFVLPPKGTAGIGEGDVKVTFEYDVVTEDSALAGGYTCIKATKTLSLPVGTMKQGYSYRFIFTFYVNKVTVEGDSTDWNDEIQYETEY